jgi:hypothetical protein
MMTMDERVEAAQDAMCESKMWPVVFASGAAAELARIALAAAFPELQGDKPTHWLAPWDITEHMAAEMECQFSTESQWTAARDAYLGKGDGG